MMTEKESASVRPSKKAYLIAGIFTVVPLIITWWVVKFIWQLLRDFGRPAVMWIALALRPFSSRAADILASPWFDPLMAVVLVLVGLYALGWFATRVIGQRLLKAFDALVQRVPLVNTVYTSVQKFLAVLQTKPDGVQRVVLINFPSPDMKAVGFVTRTLKDADTGRTLAAVYVPTTPNPTSGYLEIVPTENVISTTWTMDEAMTFIISGGAVAPPQMNFDKSAAVWMEPNPPEK
jgi:uncharacterized membrane protein